MLLFLILQVDARVLVFSAAGMATRCPATGVDKNSYGTATAQLRHSYGTATAQLVQAGKSVMTSVMPRVIPLLCTRQTNLSLFTRPNCTIMCSSQDRRLDLGNCKKSCHIFPLAEVSHFCTTRFDDQAVLYVSHGCPKVIPKTDNPSEFRIPAGYLIFRQTQEEHWSCKAASGHSPLPSQVLPMVHMWSLYQSPCIIN